MASEDWGRFTPSRKVHALKEIYEVGNSSAIQMAERVSKKYNVSVTRNAIIGFYSRNPDLRKTHPLTGNSGDHSPSGRTASSEIAKRLAKEAKEKREAAKIEAAKKREDRSRKLKELREIKALPEARGDVVMRRQAMKEFFDSQAVGIELLGLVERQCRFPQGDGPFVFCGRNDLSPGRPYCFHHTRLAYEAKAA